MKTRVAILFLFFSFLAAFGCQTEEEDFPALKGPYFGQIPPGTAPEVFLPGVLNSETMGAFCSVFSPEGDEYYFVYYKKEDESWGGLARMKRVNNTWTRPEILPFNSSDTENDMCLSSDGKRLIFRSWRALPDGRKPQGHSYLLSLIHI